MERTCLFVNMDIEMIGWDIMLLIKPLEGDRIL